MRSLTTKILIWSLSTLALSVVAFVWISNAVTGRVMSEGFGRFQALTLYQARSAYEAGGKAALTRYLSDVERYVVGAYHLTDGQSIDLVTGEDRSALFAKQVAPRIYRADLGKEMSMGMASEDGRYRLAVVFTPAFTLITFVPYYLVLLAVVGTLSWFFAFAIASPLRRLTKTVERFGRGDLSARVPSRRRDEIGELQRSLNEMAGRIETLLTAERRLLQDVSHELRSPLVRLAFAAELARTSPDRDGAVSRMREEIDRLSELVSSLLKMTMAEGDPAAHTVEDVCLTDLVEELACNCELEATARNCWIDMEAAQDVWVSGDHELLRRAIENVLRNAIRYAPRDSRVEMRLAAGADQAEVTVRDFGPGVPKEMLPRIFSPFFRVDASRSEETGGMGLGLAIAQRAMRLHHGTIKAANANPGLLVTISLPAAQPVRPC